MSQKSRQKAASRVVPIPDQEARVATKPATGLLGGLWWEIKDFSGLNGTATYLWPRWLVLRAVGVVYLFVFGGILVEGQALIGPSGIAPLDEFFRQLSQLYPDTLRAMVNAPSLFWLNTSAGMVGFLSWAGFFSAIALVLNLWPRMALFACWLIFLSFASTWRVFSPAQLDNLMIEVALLCIPFAPAGYRPGLGADSPPRPIALFMVRWLLFRVMFESGLVKITAGDPHWRDFTAMEVMYETSPFPTILSYFDHHLPHAYHLFEIALTFTAELVAPLAAVFLGRRGRWFAFITWTVFQTGIQLTSNFGWLNTASIGLGFLLLDDQMIASAAAKFRLGKLAAFLAARATRLAPQPLPRWQRYGLRAALWTHFYLTLFFFAKACGVTPASVPQSIAWPVNVFSEFRSANGYFLYARFKKERYQVEYEGTNDGGLTWRTYEYRYMPQKVDEICPFFAPWFARFEATVEIAGWSEEKARLIPVVATHLLARNPGVIRFFRNDPFTDRPATVIRMRGYRFTFTDLKTWRETGHFWKKEPAGDYLPALYIDAAGQPAEFNLEEADHLLRAGRLDAALALLESQFRLGNTAAGFRLADMYSRGFGNLRPDARRAFNLNSELAAQGETGGEHNLAVCYEYGVGTPVDSTKAAYWYARAATHGYAFSLYNLALLHVKDRIQPRNDIEGLTLLHVSASRAKGGDPASLFIAKDVGAQIQSLRARMSAADQARAEAEAALRIKFDNLAPAPVLTSQGLPTQ